MCRATRAAALLLAGFMPCIAQAQRAATDYPSRPIRVIVPFVAEIGRAHV